jgi:hypothetical protein
MISIMCVKSLKKTLRHDISKDKPAVKSRRFTKKNGIKRTDNLTSIPKNIINTKRGIKERIILTILEKIMDSGKTALGRYTLFIRLALDMRLMADTLTECEK